MEKSKYLLQVESEIGMYNREDVLRFDIARLESIGEKYRIFEFQKGLMRGVYFEIKIGDIK
jgi:hypothetical protein